MKTVLSGSFAMNKKKEDCLFLIVDWFFLEYFYCLIESSQTIRWVSFLPISLRVKFIRNSTCLSKA